MKKLGIAIGAALGVVFIAPAIVGGVVESKYNDILDELSTNPQFQVVESQFTKGWFSGTSVARLKFVTNVPELDQFQLVVHEDISFGPVIFGDQGLSFSLAHSDAKFSIEGEGVSDAINKVLNENLTFLSEITYGMDYVSAFELDEISHEQDGNSFKVGKLSGEMTLSEEKYSKLDMNWQGLEFNGPKAKVNISGARILMDQELISGSMYGGDALFIGDMTFDIPQVTATTPDDVEMFSMTDLSISAGSDIENNLVDMNLTYGAKEIKAAQQVYKNANINIDFKKLDADVLGELNTMLTSLSQDPQAMANNMQQLTVIATKLLAKDPEISISDLSVETPDGKIQSDAVVSIDNNIYDPNNPMSLIAAVKADAKGSGPALFFEKFGLKPMLDMYVQQGLLIRNDAELSFKVNFEQGQLNVNGNPMPLM